MRIAAVASTWWPDVSGASVSLRDRVAWFRARGHEIRLFAPLATAASAVPADWAEGITPMSGIWSLQAGSGNVRPTSLGILAACRAIKVWRPDLVWVESPDKLRGVSLVWPGAWCKPAPVVGFVHSDLPRAAEDGGYPAIAEWLRIVGALGFGGCDWLVVALEDGLELVPKRHWSRVRVFQHLHAPAPSAAAPRRPSPEVVWIGRATVEKGWPEFLQVATALNEVGVRCHAYLPELPSPLGPITDSLELRCGWSRHAIMAALHEGDVLLCTSRRESFGLAILEAMLMGLIPVLPDLPTLQRWVGTRGWYYSEREPVAIRAAVLSAMAGSTPEISLDVRRFAASLNGCGLEGLQDWMNHIAIHR